MNIHQIHRQVRLDDGRELIITLTFDIQTQTSRDGLLMTGYVAKLVDIESSDGEPVERPNRGYLHFTRTGRMVSVGSEFFEFKP